MRADRWFLLAMGTFAVLALGAYIWHFHGQGISPDAEDWARFGEYVGGAFAMLAFIGALYTVHLQGQQLDLARRQTTIEEVQRLMRAIAQDLEPLLDAPLQNANKQIAKDIAASGIPLSVRGYFKRAYDITAQGRKPDRLPLKTLYAGSVSAEAELIGNELGRLERAMGIFIAKGGDRVIADYYREQYREIVVVMKILGFDAFLGPDVMRWASG